MSICRFPLPVDCASVQPQLNERTVAGCTGVPSGLSGAGSLSSRRPAAAYTAARQPDIVLFAK